ncbi:MAG: hypothetical protein LAT56_14700 [Wenzhouxiangella sp.]|nr:hypothetical protein [Wenzhouxiangella sp.]
MSEVDLQDKAVQEFTDFIGNEVIIAREMGLMSGWDLYEHLKKHINDFDINYETAIKIITERTGI